MATTRIYVIANKHARDLAGNDLPARLVSATNASQALRHVAADTLAVALATQYDCIRLAKLGVDVEISRTEPAQQQEPT